MAKDGRIRFCADDPSSKAAESQHNKRCKLNSQVDPAENVKEWEEARCPICMEHPHNAVLLICSSQEKGCRPYVCNTSHRHSNCLDQFYKSPVPSPSTVLLQQVPSLGAMSLGAAENHLLSQSIGLCRSNVESKLVCPFCRGKIYGWVVVEAARQYMNSKIRNCSSEICKFSGNYLELRKHARCVHPYDRPSEADPSRQQDWMRLEQETELENFRSTLQSASGEDGLEVSQSSLGQNERLEIAVMDLLSSTVSLAVRMLETVSGSVSGSEMYIQRPTRRTFPGRNHNEGDYARWPSDASGRRYTNSRRLHWRGLRCPARYRNQGDHTRQAIDASVGRYTNGGRLRWRDRR